MCLRVSSFSDRVAGVLADEAQCACARKCARAAPIEPREVPLRRFQSPARLTGPFEGTFVRACATLSNRRRSTKVPFPNINFNAVSISDLNKHNFVEFALIA